MAKLSDAQRQALSTIARELWQAHAVLDCVFAAMPDPSTDDVDTKHAVDAARTILNRIGCLLDDVNFDQTAAQYEREAA